MSDELAQIQTEEQKATEAQLLVRRQITELLSQPEPDPILYRKLGVQEIHYEICKGHKSAYRDARDLAGVRGVTADMLSFKSGDTPTTDASDWEAMLSSAKKKTPSNTGDPTYDRIDITKRSKGLDPKKVRAIIDTLELGTTFAATSRMFNVSMRTVQRYSDRHIRDKVPLPAIDTDAEDQE